MHSLLPFMVQKYIDQFAADHDEYNKILVQILADRFVEAFAECLHEKVRKEYWGYDQNETLTNEQMIREEYKVSGPHQAIRPVPTIQRKLNYLIY